MIRKGSKLFSVAILLLHFLVSFSIRIINCFEPAKYFTERTQVSLINLLGSTKRKELRNQIILIFQKLVFKEPAESLRQAKSVNYDSDQIAVLLKREIVTVVRTLQSSAATSSVVETKTIYDILKPAIEQTWIECCSGRCGKEELELFSAIFQLIDYSITEEVNLHNWLRVRLATPFPVLLKTSPIIRAKVNIQLAQVYLKSFDLRFVKKRPDQTEHKVMKSINQFIVDTLKDEKNLDPEMSRLLLSLACSLELRLTNFASEDQSALEFILRDHLANKELNATRRNMINELFEQIDHQSVQKFLRQKLPSLLDELFSLHQVAYSKLNMTLVMSLESSILSGLRALNHLMRITSMKAEFPLDRLAQVFVMDSAVQMAFVDILYLLPRDDIQERLAGQIDTVVQHWCNELLETATLVRLIYLVKVDEDFVNFARDILFRPIANPEVDNNAPFQSVHDAFSRFLCRFDKDVVDDLLSEKITSFHPELLSAAITITNVILDKGNYLTRNVIESSLAILFSENEKRNLLEEGLVKRCLLFDCLKEKR